MNEANREEEGQEPATAARAPSPLGPSDAQNGGANAPSVPPVHCRNCGAPLTGPWCAQCGQRLRDLDRPFLALLSEFLENVLSFDGRAARTLRLLLFRPGELTCRYLAGQRVRFVPPVRLFVIVLVVFFLALEISDVALVQFRLRPAGAPGSGIVSLGVGQERRSFDLVLLAPAMSGAKAEAPLLREKELAALQGEAASGGRQAQAGVAYARRLIEGFQRALADPAPLNAFLRVWLPRVLFLLIPVFAVLLRGLVRRRRYVDHVVFALHLHAFFFLVATLMIPLAVAGWSQWAGRVWVLVCAAYLLAAVRRFGGMGWLVTGLRSAVLVVLYTVMVMMTLVVLLLVGVGRP